MAERESKKEDMKIGLTLLQVQELWFLFQQINRRLEDQKESWVNKLSGDRACLYILIEEFRYLKDVTEKTSARVDEMKAEMEASMEKIEARQANMERDLVETKATTAEHRAILDEQKAFMDSMEPRIDKLIKANQEKDEEILRLQAEVKKLLQEKHRSAAAPNNNKKRKAEDAEDHNPSLLKAARQALTGLFGFNSGDE